MQTSTLIERVKELVQTDLVAARPYLKEILKRISDQPDVRENAQFFVALSEIEEYRVSKDQEVLKRAVQEFHLFLKEYPESSRAELVRLNLADSLMDLQQYGAAIDNYKHVYDKTRSSEMRSEVRTLLANAYIKADRAVEGIPVFQEAFDRSLLDPELRSQAAAWLLQGYLANNQAAKILPYFQYLTGKREALFNPRFNINMIQAGDALFDKGEYSFAVLFYAIIKERTEIITFFEGQVQSLSENMRLMDATSDDYTMVQARLQQAEANLKAVREMPDYNADVKWRVARVYLESGRSWEALWAFYHLYQDYPRHKQVEDFLFLAFSQAKLVNEDALIEQLANDYLGETEYKRYRDQVIVDLADYYARKDYLEKLTALVEDYLTDVPANEQVGMQLINYLSLELMAIQRYADLFDYTDNYYKRFQGLNETLMAASYWRALSLIVMANYVDSLAAFNEFLEKYDTSSPYYEDAFFRRAIALFGVDQPEDSERELNAFVEQYPSSHLRGEAELYLGDLARLRGALEEAMGHYNTVYEMASDDNFISKAVFAISEIHTEMGNLEDAVTMLQKYIDDFGEKGQIDEAYKRMGMLYDQSGRHPERYEIHLKAVTLLGNDAQRYAVDEIIIAYIKDYTKLNTTYQASAELMQRLLSDTEFRDGFIQNVAQQYTYFNTEEGQKIDPNLVNQLMRDRESRRRIRENPEGSLTKLLDYYTERVVSIKPFAPQVVFGELALVAKAKELAILSMRMSMAKDLFSDLPSAPHYSVEQLQVAPPATIVHEAAKYGLGDADTAVTLYNLVLEKHPYSKTVYDALLSLAKLYDEQAKAKFDETLYTQALKYYDEVIQRFAFKAEGAEHYLAKARILNELGRGDEAIDVLGQVIKNPQWRGVQHAEAHLQLGLANLELNLLAEAHGFFERLIVAYGGFKEFVALGYYWDLVTLERMNERQSIQQLLEELRTRKDLVNTEGYEKVKEKYEL